MFWCPQASAVPQLVVHEGLVLDEDGVPKSGPVAIRISLYAAASGGDALWFEDYDLVLVDGYYAVQLGSSEELGDVFDGGSRYLGVELDHGGELTPRHPVASVPYALVARNAVGDITPRSVSVGGHPVIDADGSWVGPPVSAVADGVCFDSPDEVIAAVRERDGGASGLDADFLDGLDSTQLWQPAADGAAATLLLVLKAADGAGSGLDADRLDTFDSSQFLRADQDTRTIGALRADGGLSTDGPLTAEGAVEALSDLTVGGTLQSGQIYVAAGSRVGVGVAEPRAAVEVDGDVIADNLVASSCQADSIVLAEQDGPPADPAPGTLYYDRDAAGLRFFDGSEWAAVGGGGGGGGGGQDQGGEFRRSCYEIFEADESRGDGIYTIDPDGGDGANAIRVYCDMTTAGGGWTLVLLSNANPAGCPTPTWNQAVGDITYNGGDLSRDLTSFDMFLGVRHWSALGSKLRLEAGAGPHSLAHRAYYDAYVSEANHYQLSLTNEQVTIHAEGSSSSGLFAYHNNRSLSTRDADHDVAGGNCSSSYCNSPWWYGECWSGNLWGGCGCNHTDDAYWNGSNTGQDHYPYGSIWLRGPPRGQEAIRRSCYEIVQADASRGDGIYTVDPDGDGPSIAFQVFCDMTTDGGGWTLVLLNNGGVAGCPRPTWAQAVNSVTYNGPGPAIDLRAFDVFVGVKYWKFFGATLRVEAGSSPEDLSHRAYYSVTLDQEDHYRINLSGERVTIHSEGDARPGLFGYHNNRPLSTHDADHDATGGNCSSSYCNSPWWYGECWSGNFWGGCGCNHTDDAYWNGSNTGSDHFAWGAFWVRGAADDGVMRADCKAILDDGASRGDGAYTIDPNGGSADDAVRTYCDMTTDGGGWTLVASNYGGDHTFPRGTSKVGYYLDRDGHNDDPGYTSDYLIGPQMADLDFTEARVFADRSNNGVEVTDLKWPQACYRCFASDNGVGRDVTLLARHTVGSIGCGSANHCNVDGQHADTFDGAWDSNANQRTIGGVCTSSCPDPSCGTYVGHGHNEGSTYGEGSYYHHGSCSHQDDSVYTTWVR